MVKKLYVPRVEDKNSNMRMFHISCMDDLIANSMDILEPAAVDANGNEREDGELILQNVGQVVCHICLSLQENFEALQ